MDASTRAAQDQVSQNSGTNEIDDLQTLLLNEELLAAGFGGKGESFVLRDVTTDRIPMIQWIAPTHTYMNSTNWT